MKATSVWSGRRVNVWRSYSSPRPSGGSALHLDELAPVGPAQHGREMAGDRELEAPRVRVERAVERGDHRVGREHAHELAELREHLGGIVVQVRRANAG